jgi:hypothetical protein
VHVDPDSPTGQEYDIPLERARRQASSNPSGSSQPSRSSSEALFGEGIEPATGAARQQDASGQPPSGQPGQQDASGQPPSGQPSAGPDRATDAASGRSDRAGERPTKRSRERSEKSNRNPPPAVQAAVENPGAPADGPSSALLLGGISAVVLIAGAAAGLFLRRRGS